MTKPLTMILFAFLLTVSWGTGIRRPVWVDGQWQALRGRDLEPMNPVLAASWSAGELLLVASGLTFAVAGAAVFIAEGTIKSYEVCGRYEDGGRWETLFDFGKFALIVAMTVAVIGSGVRILLAR